MNKSNIKTSDCITIKKPKLKKGDLVFINGKPIISKPKNKEKWVKAWIHKSAIESRQNVFYPHDIIVHHPSEYVEVLITPIKNVGKNKRKKK